jgi:hypothetical protein
MGFLQRCIHGFRRVNFADQASGRIYLAIESGIPASIDRTALEAAISDPDTLSALQALAPSALGDELPRMAHPHHLRDEGSGSAAPTLGQWGLARSA